MRCQWIREDDTPCDRPAVWHTDDLQEFHHLCGDCHIEAERLNTFRSEALDG